MTADKATLIALFQTGDVPTGADYANMINSQVNIAETAEQTMAGKLNVTELVTPTVSATNFNLFGRLSVATIADVSNIDSGNNITVSSQGNVNVKADSAITISAGNGVNILTPGTIEISAATNVQIDAGSSIIMSAAGSLFMAAASKVIVSATGMQVGCDVSATGSRVHASAANFTSGVYQGVGVVSAAGSAQATAAPLTFVINRGKGVVDGQTTGFGLLSNRAGLTQYLYNEGVSANLWPPTGGTINGLAANLPLALAASAGVTIVHLTASAYMVK